MCHGLPLDGGISRIGHRRLTSTKDLLAALGKIAADGRFRTLGRRTPVLSMPDPCIIRVKWEARGSHYVLRHGTRIYDPALPDPVDLLEWTGRLAERWGRIASYLALRLPSRP